MKRFALFSCSLFLCLLVSKANPISRSQALSQAKEFLSSKGISMKTNDAAFRAPRKVNAQSDENSAYYYVFNAGNDKGFVIVSGDDRTEQILGYSDTGSFDEEDVPEPLQEMLKGYEREIEALGDLNFVPTATPKKVIEKTKKAIAPMTKSKWGHGYPYDQKTPLSGGVHTSVGCVPTAVGQFLYYYRDKSVKATTAAIANGSSTIASGTKIDWDNMLDEYAFNSGYTTTQINAVANLMLYCGRAMKSTYGSSTITSFDQILPALTKCFGYNDECAMIYRDFYSIQEWNDIVYNELINGRIVLLGGYTVGDAGHAFIADGYDSNDYFHINWGWFGRYNGYFRLSVLSRDDPSVNVVGGSSYNAQGAAYIYVSPQKNVSVNPGVINLSALFTSASGSTIKCSYYNQSGYDASFLFGLGYLDGEEAHLIKEFSTTAASVGNGKYVTKSFSLASSDFTNLGLYDIVPMYKMSGESEWKKCQYAVENHVVVS
ncbi:MAG: C10 family peptidase, partial [Prevotella sp.]|nr:C10 family peptidase [Prevotella sp.]